MLKYDFSHRFQGLNQGRLYDAEGNVMHPAGTQRDNGYCTWSEITAVDAARAGAVRYELRDIDGKIVRDVPLAPEAPCSLCGRPSGETACGADWYLCRDCEGTPAAVAAGYAHNKES